MAARNRIYNARSAGQHLGYIEGDKAFDLFGRPCASYNSDTGLLRDPERKNIILGYITLTGAFVGSTWIAEELFRNQVRILRRRATPEEPKDRYSGGSIHRLERGDPWAVDAPRPVAQMGGEQQSRETKSPVAPSVEAFTRRFSEDLGPNSHQTATLHAAFLKGRRNGKQGEACSN